MADEEPVSFKTKMAESIYYLIKNRNKFKSRQTDLFQPGRMMYEWDWSCENGKWKIDDFVPHSVVRSKQEVRSYEMVCICLADEELLMVV